MALVRSRRGPAGFWAAPSCGQCSRTCRRALTEEKPAAAGRTDSEEEREEEYRMRAMQIQRQLGIDEEVVTPQMRTKEEELEAQELARNYLKSDGVAVGDMKVTVFQVRKRSMSDDPEVKYRTDKTLMQETLDRGDVHLLEVACQDLLESRPDDAEVWRALTISRLRLKLWDAALEAAKRWITMEPRSLNPRCAYAFAQAGTQDLAKVEEATARFAQLHKEVTKLGDAARDVATELAECAWRCDELAEHLRKEKEEHEAGDARKASSSADIGEIIAASRPPHFFLPNFGDSIGPVKVVQAEDEELGGGAKHARKLIVTRDCEPGDLLFVQSAFAFANDFQDQDGLRVNTALTTLATTSARHAKLLDILVDADEPLGDGEDIVACLRDVKSVREEGPWDEEGMPQHIKASAKVCNRYLLETGRNYIGLWVLPALARQSCVPSAVWTAFGDIFVARAARPLSAGDEVTFSFDSLWGSLEERQERYTESRGSFWCKCPRCEAEGRWDFRSEAALKRFTERVGKQRSRMNAVFETLKTHMEEDEKEAQRLYQRIRNREEENKELVEGLRGLADNLFDKEGLPRNPGDATVEELQNLMPKRERRVEVKEDLAIDVLDAVKVFEEDVKSIGLSREHENWLIASQAERYMEVLSLMRLREDVQGQQRVLERIGEAVGSTAPGSFDHLFLGVCAWEALAASQDPDVLSQEASLFGEDVKLVREALNIRYGKDLKESEMGAALGRVAATRARDENWMWEITWAIGSSLPTDELRGPNGKLPPFLGSTILV
eukprot:TRINITY_DN26272_c0_g1_i1.p1 TRINITY_DN26272_c0_g1~~TRINITY_DN26272_c0_g1_i1.p1  ORF type:complete len:852 (+),score=186.31 TRINITY_DN26272_c0_g1_i1:214-2556(+)